jgi:ATP-dependent protease HslVU (ClpYQ) peptidase subunit
MIGPQPKPLFRKPRDKRLPTTRKARAMTICIGFQCRDGLVLAADRQMTMGHTYQECKLHQLKWKNGRAIWGYAATNADTSKIVALEVERKFTLDTSVSRSEIPDVLKEVLTKCLKGKNKESFVTLLGARTEGEQKSLLISNNRDVIYGERCEVIGLGDSALSRFFRGLFLRMSLTVYQASILAIYVIKQEKAYNGQYIGGGTDVFFLEDSSPLMRLFTESQTLEWERELSMIEGVIARYFQNMTDPDVLPQTKVDGINYFNSTVQSLAERIKFYKGQN